MNQLLLGSAPIDNGWLVLGMQLGLDDTVTRCFLLACALVWVAAGGFAVAQRRSTARPRRFWCCFLLTFIGNMGVVVAQDVASFYGFYSFMTVSAYGLIAHAQTEASRRAGRVYLVMALLAEMLLLTAFLFLVGAGINRPLVDVPRVVAESTHPGGLAGLLVLGFGVKAGAFLLHFWLPLAHPVAPTAASAVLSGAVLKAGLLGWLRFLPIGHLALPVLGSSLVIAGLCAAFLAALAGVTQDDPKTVLAYSSVSQMGFMTTAVGLGLTHPAAHSALLAAAAVFVLHHALVKGALFLGSGVAHATSARAPSRVVTLGLAVAAYQLSGAPFSSGALAKAALGPVLNASPRAELLSWLLSLAAVGSTLLMARFLLRGAPAPTSGGSAPSAGLWVPSAALVVLPMCLVVAPPGGVDTAKLFRLSGVWAAAWPPLAGVVIACATRAWVRRASTASRRLERLRVPPGDLLLVIEPLWGAFQRAGAALRRAEGACLQRAQAAFARLAEPPGRALRFAARVEPRLGRFAVLGLSFLVLLLVTLCLELVPLSSAPPDGDASAAAPPESASD